MLNTKGGKCEEEKGKTRGDACRAVQRGLCEKIICKKLAMIVKYLRWQLLRRKRENKGGAIRGVQRGLCEKNIYKMLAMIVKYLR